jgi:NADH dehydrogenase [ubiquinone] 1 alpha subcomplex assembly factor 6
VPFHASQRRIYLPTDLLRDAGIEPGQLIERGPQAGLRPVVEAIAAEATRWSQKARSSGGASRLFLPALLPLTLSDIYHRRLAKAAFDPFDARVQQAPPWRVWALALRWALGKP